MRLALSLSFSHQLQLFKKQCLCLDLFAHIDLCAIIHVGCDRFDRVLVHKEEAQVRSQATQKFLSRNMLVW